jgi:hypothetical protein
MQGRKIFVLSGRKFGRLTVIKLTHKDKHRRYYYDCICECGNTKNILNNSLISGDTRSCGCLHKEVMTKHGLKGTSFYSRYIDMKRRCYDAKRESYKYYGGRGITVCQEWLDDFINFKNDMYESYLEHVKEFGVRQTSIDRKDNNGNYSKENCKWSTGKEQRVNQRERFTHINFKKFKAISPEGKVFFASNQSEFARKHMLSGSNINNCLRGRELTCKGWQFEYI